MLGLWTKEYADGTSYNAWFSDIDAKKATWYGSNPDPVRVLLTCYWDSEGRSGTTVELHGKGPYHQSCTFEAVVGEQPHRVASRIEKQIHLEDLDNPDYVSEYGVTEEDVGKWFISEVSARGGLRKFISDHKI